MISLVKILSAVFFVSLVSCEHIILLESDIIGTCSSTCTKIPRKHNFHGCETLSNCVQNSIGWTSGWYRCDYCKCYCERYNDEADVKVSETLLSKTEKEIYGTCGESCYKTGLVRTNAFDCHEVRDCKVEQKGPYSLFYRCDYCTCTCINKKHAKTYKLENMVYDMSASALSRGKPITMAQTTITNKGNDRQRIRRSLAFNHVNENSVTNSHMLQAGLSVTVSVGVKKSGITEVTGGLSTTGSLTTGFTYTAGEKQTKGQADTIMVEAYVNAKHRKEILIVGYRMQLDVPYKADLRITYADGSTEVEKTKGVYTSVDMGEFHVTYNEAEPLEGYEGIGTGSGNAGNGFGDD